MCQYRILKVRRALKNTEKVVLLHEDNLNRILSGPLFSILLSDRWEETGISRSYYYSGLKTLRELRLIEDRAIQGSIAISICFYRMKVT